MVLRGNFPGLERTKRSNEETPSVLGICQITLVHEVVNEDVGQSFHVAVFMLFQVLSIFVHLVYGQDLF